MHKLPTMLPDNPQVQPSHMFERLASQLSPAEVAAGNFNHAVTRSPAMIGDIDEE